MGLEMSNGLLPNSVKRILENIIEEEIQAISDILKDERRHAEIEKDIKSYLRNHEEDVFRSNAFKAFLKQPSGIEQVYIFALGRGATGSTEAFVNMLMKLFWTGAEAEGIYSQENDLLIRDFLRYVFERIDQIIKRDLGKDQVYILHKIESGLKDIPDQILSEIRKYQEASSAGGFGKILSEIPSVKDYNASPFHYVNKSMKNIYGRNPQLQILQDFLSYLPNFAFCVVTGPGGVGKSKLVYSFAQQVRESGLPWEVLFADEDTLVKISECEQWNHPRDTLLIIDYAGISPELLHRCVLNIVDHEKVFVRKLRLILLDRVGMVRVKDPQSGTLHLDYPNWYKTIINRRSRDHYADPEYISRYLYGKFIELDGLFKEEYEALIRDFVKVSQCDSSFRNRGTVHQITEPEIEEIIAFAERTSGSLKATRPIYVMLAADAVMHGGDLSDWNTDQLMQDIYSRDLYQWEGMVGDEDVFRSLKQILIYSTVFGEWASDSVPEISGENVARILERALRDTRKKDGVEDWLRHMCGASCLEGCAVRIPAFEPDIVGEFYVLKQLSYAFSSIAEWCRLFYDHIEMAEPFWSRACQDFSNSDLQGTLFDVLDRLTELMKVDPSLEKNAFRKVECILRLWDGLHCDIKDRTRKAGAEKHIRDNAEAYQGKSRIIDEYYVKYYISNPADHANSWRKERLEVLRSVYLSWPNSTLITTTYIEMLGALASSAYRNGNLEQGNQHSQEINRIVQNQLDNNEILIAYIRALGDIISGHYYMNDLANTQAEIDPPNTIAQVAEKLDREGNVVAYVETVRKIITQQAKYTADERIVLTAEQFCTNLRSWIWKDDWYLFRWSIGSMLPYAIYILLFHEKRRSANVLLETYVQIIEQYISRKYRENDMMVLHFSRGIDKLTQSDFVTDVQRKKLCEAVQLERN